MLYFISREQLWDNYNWSSVLKYGVQHLIYRFTPKGRDFKDDCTDFIKSFFFHSKSFQKIF